MWNDLQDSSKFADSLSSFKKTILFSLISCNVLYYFGDRWPSIHHARLRIGCSKLNDDLFSNLHVIDSPKCPCGSPTEDRLHFFFHCPLYGNERKILLDSISVIAPPSLELLLFGQENLSLSENERVFLAVHSYICNSKRFDSHTAKGEDFICEFNLV